MKLAGNQAGIIFKRCFKCGLNRSYLPLMAEMPVFDLIIIGFDL